jgi:hypothetical protein
MKRQLAERAQRTADNTRLQYSIQGPGVSWAISRELPTAIYKGPLRLDFFFAYRCRIRPVEGMERQLAERAHRTVDNTRLQCSIRQGRAGAQACQGGCTGRAG